MISIVYGVPGSGKSYYSVWWLKKRALTEGEVFFRVKDNVLLITNLRLNLDSMDNYVYIEGWDDWKKYMDVDFWKANLVYIQGKRIIMVMDEAQVFFKLHGDDARVLFFLQYHRHLSVDILLITQSPKSLPQKIFELAEFLVEAVPKSINPFSFKAFRYRVVHPFDRSLVLRRFHIAYDPAIFYLYRDMIYTPSDEDEKPKNAFIPYYVFILSLLFITFAFLFFFFSRFFSPSLPSQAKSQTQPIPSSVMEIEYEDLITEEKQEKPKPEEKPIEKPSQEKPKEDIPIPSFSDSYYRIVISKPSADSPKEDVLNPSVKVIEIP